MSTAFTYNPGHESHRQPNHPERPDRLTRLLDRLQQAPIWPALVQVAATPAALDETLRVHEETYLQRVEQAVAQGRRLDADTYVTSESLDIARQALGGVLAVTHAVLEGTAANGFAAVRPPGHHATPTRAMGFCLFNHIAVAARWAQDHYGIERIAIVDFDVHHGNGTQDIFYNDPDVLFVSTHQHPLYPGTGRAGETGTGRGEGTTVNVPLPPGTGDAGYQAAFRRVVLPAVRRFQPELLLVSAGYDAHPRDPIANMQLSTHGFARLVYDLMACADACCDGRLVATLEGGYDLDGLSQSVLASLQVLHDPEAISDVAPDEPSPREAWAVDDLLDELAARHHL